MHVTFLPTSVDIFTGHTPFQHYAALLYLLPHEEKMMTMINAIMVIMNMVMMVMLDAAIETD